MTYATAGNYPSGIIWVAASTDGTEYGVINDYNPGRGDSFNATTVFEGHIIVTNNSWGSTVSYDNAPGWVKFNNYQITLGEIGYQ